MNSLVWRLHRNQVFFAGLVLGLLALVLLITGITMADDYHRFLADCAATRSCSSGAGQLFSGDGAIIDLVNLTIVVPLLFGLFWGAPLVAKEFEDGTQNLVWTQGVGRRRWLSSNVSWAFVAAACWGGAMTALVSWWRIPENALGSRFDDFDIQGVAPVAYALFAVALGIVVGSIVRRVLPAMATTLGVFVGLRVVIAIYLRPHYLSPMTRTVPLGASDPGGGPGAWLLSSGFVGPNGHTFGLGLALSDFPAACRSSGLGINSLSLRCVAAHGFRQVLTFQPGNRFWTFQAIESGIFILLAAALLAWTYRAVLKRDA